MARNLEGRGSNLRAAARYSMWFVVIPLMTGSAVAVAVAAVVDETPRRAPVDELFRQFLRCAGENGS